MIDRWRSVLLAMARHRPEMLWCRKCVKLQARESVALLATVPRYQLESNESPTRLRQSQCTKSVRPVGGSWAEIYGRARGSSRRVIHVDRSCRRSRRTIEKRRAIETGGEDAARVLGIHATRGIVFVLRFVRRVRAKRRVRLARNEAVSPKRAPVPARAASHTNRATWDDRGMGGGRCRQSDGDCARGA